MQNDAQYYLGLLTSEHRDKPHFVAVVSEVVEGPVEAQAVAAQLEALYDLDTAVGVQLDAIGLWVGISRKIAVPITGVYFTWNDTALTGWASGVWQGPFDPSSGLVSLSDDDYRVLLRARIAANHWDGTIGTALAYFGPVLGPMLTLVIVDNQDMSETVAVVGTGLTAVKRALVLGGYLPLAPSGVRIKDYFLPAASGKMFAWGTEGPSLGGWSEASWGIEYPGS